MKEGSALLAALALAAGIAYWSDHFRLVGWGSSPASDAPFPYQSPAEAARAPVSPATEPERLEVQATDDPAAKAALCGELLEVIHGVDAALQHPQSAASAERLVTRRRAYVAQRIALGC